MKSLSIWFFLWWTRPALETYSAIFITCKLMDYWINGFLSGLLMQEKVYPSSASCSWPKSASLVSERATIPIFFYDTGNQSSPTFKVFLTILESSLFPRLNEKILNVWLQFWLPSHLHLMTGRKASKQFFSPRGKQCHPKKGCFVMKGRQELHSY